MPARILIVCTANVCRSPMASAMFQHRFASAGADVRVTSAGTARVDLPVDPVAVRVLSERGIDISGHRPRRVSATIVDEEGADLVITMTRDQLRTVATKGRATFQRTFTLRELAREVSKGNPERLHVRSDNVPESFRRIRDLAVGRRPSDLLGDSAQDDIDDPYGRGVSAVRTLADEMDGLIGSLFDRLW